MFNVYCKKYINIIIICNRKANSKCKQLKKNNYKSNYFYNFSLLVLNIINITTNLLRKMWALTIQITNYDKERLRNNK